MRNTVLLLLLFFTSLSACRKDETTVRCSDAGRVFSTSDGAVVSMSIYLDTHNSLYLPSFAVWTEKAGKVKTLYATCKAAFKSWDGGVSRREALPVWYGSNAREVLQPEVFEIDAVTSATPSVTPFILLVDFLPLRDADTIRVYVEVNASRDKNEYYRDEVNGQPSVVWQARGFTNVEGKHIMERFHIIGHGSVDGSGASIYSDTSGITTAASLIEKIEINPSF
ncbi:MAG TPA: hypothetical protein VE870_13840 [Bacteroidales bacterium]|nr:hypothetical protein [Bacteroidales bacterium]